MGSLPKLVFLLEVKHHFIPLQKYIKFKIKGEKKGAANDASE